MAEKNNNNGAENKNKNNDTNNNDGGEKKEDGSSASKIVKRVKPFQGAESVKSEAQANKLTVVGKVDPTKLRDELATKTKNKVDPVSPQPKKDNKVNNDDANDTKKKKPEKTDNDEKPKEAPLKLRNLRVLNRISISLGVFYLFLVTSLTPSGCFSLLEHIPHLKYLEVSKIEVPDVVSTNDGNDGNDGDDGNDGNGGGVGEEKKKEGDEGNGGGKMKYPAGQSGFGQFPYETVYRHGYGYQNGALKMGEKMLLLCCEVFGLLVMYNHFAKDIYTNVTLYTHSGGSIKVQEGAAAPLFARKTIIGASNCTSQLVVMHSKCTNYLISIFSIVNVFALLL